MKILITGGLGHIGSGFLHSVRADDFDEIIILDNISTQRYASLFKLPFGKRVRFIEEDIMTSDLSKIVAQADAVLHLAAITDAERSCDIPDKVRAVNFDGVRLIAESCLYEVRADRIKEKGFCFEGNIFSRIDETLDMLRGLIPFQSGTD